VIRQHGEDFVLFAALAPQAREVVHLSVAPPRNYLTTRRFFREIEALYGALSEIVITDGRANTEPRVVVVRMLGEGRCSHFL
jgi:transposase-like protein